MIKESEVDLNNENLDDQKRFIISQKVEVLKFWFSIGYFSYFIVICLLVWTYLFGLTSSGSKRWIDLYFINLQPSELMKIFIILCLAKYFHRMKLENVNSIYTILTSLIIIILPY